MTIEIQIPPELEQHLQAAADQAGISPDTYILRLLQQALSISDTVGQRLSNSEAELIQRINTSLSQIEWNRYHSLLSKRQAESLTPDEHAELIALSDQIEQINAGRIQDLAELAQIRNTSVNSLIAELGLKPISHA